MAAGDRHARASACEHRGVVHNRRGHHADVDRLDTRGIDALSEGIDQARAGQAAIPADDDGGDVLGLGDEAQRCTHALGGGIRESDLRGVAVDDASDVVGFEDRGGKVGSRSGHKK